MREGKRLVWYAVLDGLNFVDGLVDTIRDGFAEFICDSLKADARAVSTMELSTIPDRVLEVID